MEACICMKKALPPTTQTHTNCKANPSPIYVNLCLDPCLKHFPFHLLYIIIIIITVCVCVCFHSSPNNLKIKREMGSNFLAKIYVEKVQWEWLGITLSCWKGLTREHFVTSEFGMWFLAFVSPTSQVSWKLYVMLFFKSLELLLLKIYGKEVKD